LAFCLRQSIAVREIADMAIEHLASDPLLEAELYPGDLFASLLHAAAAGGLSLEQRSELHDLCGAVQSGLSKIQESIVPDMRVFLGRGADV
jgi:hypothetical protein